MNYAVGSESHQFMGQPPHPLLVRSLECTGLEATLLECRVRQQNPQMGQSPVAVCPFGNETGVMCAGMYY